MKGDNHMAAVVIDIVIDSAEALLAGLGGGLVTVFEVVIYNSTTGLTTIAEWMLVFLGLGIGLALFTAVIRKVL